MLVYNAFSLAGWVFVGWTRRIQVWQYRNQRHGKPRQSGWVLALGVCAFCNVMPKYAECNVFACRALPPYNENLKAISDKSDASRSTDGSKKEKNVLKKSRSQVQVVGAKDRCPSVWSTACWWCVLPSTLYQTDGILTWLHARRKSTDNMSARIRFYSG